MSDWQAARGVQPKNLFNVCFTGRQEGWLAESREPLLIMCLNKRFQLMSIQPEQIHITYSNKSDRPEHCSTGAPRHRLRGEHTYAHTLPHTHFIKKGLTDGYTHKDWTLNHLFHQIEYVHRVVFCFVFFKSGWHNKHVIRGNKNTVQKIMRVCPISLALPSHTLPGCRVLRLCVKKASKTAIKATGFSSSHCICMESEAHAQIIITKIPIN